MSAIGIMDLTCDYGNGKGVFGLSFDVKKGEALGFLGPNGAGKTTTIRHLMGFMKPQSGSCHIGGVDCWEGRAQIQQDLGYIPGEIRFFDEMTGAGFLSFIERYRGVKKSRRQELVERLELDTKGKLKKMSKGMKQKVGIIAALLHDPDVLVLDEPTSGLDPLMQNRFIELIQEEKARGKTIMMSSHSFEEVERTCDRVAIVRAGKLVALDPVDTLKAAQSKAYVVTMASDASAALFAKEDLAIAGVSGRQVTVQVQNNMQGFIAAMGRHPVVNLSAPAQSLEELFMQYYGKDGATHA